MCSMGNWHPEAFIMGLDLYTRYILTQLNVEAKTLRHIPIPIVIHIIIVLSESIFILAVIYLLPVLYSIEVLRSRDKLKLGGSYRS